MCRNLWFKLSSCDSRNSVLDGFTINNGLANYGGGMYINGSSLTVSNCIFTGNDAANYGGGIYNANTSFPLILNCIFEGNTSGDIGGAIACRTGSYPTIANCTIDSNTALISGGGIYVSETSHPTIINNTIVNNTAIIGTGGGIHINGNSPTATNNIIYNNSALIGGGVGIYVTAGTPIITYNDVDSNLPNDYGGWVADPSDISVDPQFVNPGIGDYHLQPISLCIDAGDNGAVLAAGLTTDYDGEPRIYPTAGTVDMGADEFFINSPPLDPFNLGPTEYTDGSTVNDDTPTLDFEQDDPDITDTVQYTIQIDDDDDFSSPVVDYTSALLAQGPTSFTSPPLPDDGYYWRVMSTDQWGAPSGWTYASVGAPAFRRVIKLARQQIFTGVHDLYHIGVAVDREGLVLREEPAGCAARLLVEPDRQVE